MHPDWEFTRTNDFWDRANLAVQHGRDAEAVVVTEMLNWPEHEISGPTTRLSRHPLRVDDVEQSTSSTAFGGRTRAGSPNHRYLCQRGRWQGFIFEK